MNHYTKQDIGNGPQAKATSGRQRCATRFAGGSCVGKRNLPVIRFGRARANKFAHARRLIEPRLTKEGSCARGSRAPDAHRKGAIGCP